MIFIFQIPLTIDDLEGKKDPGLEGKQLVHISWDETVKHFRKQSKSVLRNFSHWFRPGAQCVHQVYEVSPVLWPGTYQLQIGCIWHIASGKTKLNLNKVISAS